MNQQLFNVPAYYLSVRHNRRLSCREFFDAECTWHSDAGGRLSVSAGAGGSAQIANARALEKADEGAATGDGLARCGCGHESRYVARTGAVADPAAAVINAENTFAKDKIALTRLIGLPADQEMTLTDTAPYAEFEELPLEEAMELAFLRRKDLLGLQAQVEVAEKPEQ